jgi:hypothetical protein
MTGITNAMAPAMTAPAVKNNGVKAHEAPQAAAPAMAPKATNTLAAGVGEKLKAMA